MLWFLLACDPSLPVREETVSVLEQPGPMPLAEALYRGELGDRSQGDRLRMLLWLRSMDPDESQRAALREGANAVALRLADLDAQKQAAADEEAARLGPIYARLEEALLAGGPEDPEAFVAEIEAAREGLVDPRALEARSIEAVLEVAGQVLEELGPDQRPAVANALFVLRREVGEGVRPAAYESLIGRPWDPGDFATLRRSESGEQAALDPGGLFTLDAGETRTLARLDRERLTVILALLLQHEALLPALDLLDSADSADLPPP